MMTRDIKTVDQAATGRIVFWVGLSDVIIGVGLACAGLAGVLGEDGMVFVVLGAIMALVGAGMALWGRNKTSQADNGLGRRRD